MTPSPLRSHSCTIYSQSVTYKFLYFSSVSVIFWRSFTVNVPVWFLSSLKNSCCISCISFLLALNPEAKDRTIFWNLLSSLYLTRFFCILCCTSESNSQGFSSYSSKKLWIQGWRKSSCIDGLDNWSLSRHLMMKSLAFSLISFQYSYWVFSKLICLLFMFQSILFTLLDSNGVLPESSW